MSERRILMLGPDRYALDAAARMDVPVVLLYDAGYRDAKPLPRLAADVTPVFVDSAADPEAVLAAIEREGLPGEYTAVYTNEETSVVLASLLATAFGCPSAAPLTAAGFRDKVIQKRLVAKAGVRTAGTSVIEDLRRIPDDQLLPGPRAVVKPIRGAATSNTAAVSSVAELREFAQRALAAQPSRRTYALEEFVSGVEVAADGLVQDGRVVFWCLARYAEPLLRFIEDKDRPIVMQRLDRERDAALYRAVDEPLHTAIEALGLRDGVFHMELFADPEEGTAVFGECGMRRGGGLTQEEVMAKFGVDLAEGALRIALGERVSVEETPVPEVIGTSFLVRRQGTVISCPSPRDLCALPGVEFATIDVSFGERMGTTADTTIGMGIVLLRAADQEAFDKTAAETHEWFHQRVTVLPENRTRSELRDWQQAHWPGRGFERWLYERG